MASPNREPLSPDIYSLDASPDIVSTLQLVELVTPHSAMKYLGNMMLLGTYLAGKSIESSLGEPDEHAMAA